jgi:hypothetical protein
MIPATQARRAAAMLVTGLALVATSVGIPARDAFDAATSCGPAARIVLADPLNGCGGDPSWDVEGGAAAGLPSYAEFGHSDVTRAEDRWVLAGPVVLPGTDPPVMVRRICRVGPEVAGVRTIACEGEAPEAACEGTLTPVPQPAAGTTP